MNIKYILHHIKTGKDHDLRFSTFDGWKVSLIRGSDGIFRLYDEDAVRQGIERGYWTVTCVTQSV